MKIVSVCDGHEFNPPSKVCEFSLIMLPPDTYSIVPVIYGYATLLI